MRLIGTFLNRLLSLWPQDGRVRAIPPDQLIELRGACYTILDDLQSPLAKGLLVRVDTAKSAEAFWHMRPQLFDAVAQLHGEAAARDRLERLDAVLRAKHDRRSGRARAAPAGATAQRRRASDDSKFRPSR